MNLYEMTFIVRPDLDEEQTGGVAEEITQRLEAAGGEIKAAYPWTPPRRRLAFPIRDFGDGYYVTTVFELDPQAIRDLERGLRLNDRILRFLIVQADDHNTRQANQAMQRLQQMAQAAAAPTVQQTPAPVREPEPVLVAAEREGDLEAATAAEPVAEPVPATEPPSPIDSPVAEEAVIAVVDEPVLVEEQTTEPAAEPAEAVELVTAAVIENDPAGETPTGAAEDTAVAEPVAKPKARAAKSANTETKAEKPVRPKTTRTRKPKAVPEDEPVGDPTNRETAGEPVAAGQTQSAEEERT